VARTPTISSNTDQQQRAKKLEELVDQWLHESSNCASTMNNKTNQQAGATKHNAVVNDGGKQKITTQPHKEKRVQQ